MTDVNPLDRRTAKEYANTTFERHFVTVVVAMIFSVLGWVAFKVTVLAETTAAMQVEQRNLHDNMDDIKEELRGDISEIKKELKNYNLDRITATETEKMRDECRKNIEELRHRVQIMERDHVIRNNNGNGTH